MSSASNQRRQESDTNRPSVARCERRRQRTSALARQDTYMPRGSRQCPCRPPLTTRRDPSCAGLLLHTQVSAHHAQQTKGRLCSGGIPVAPRWCSASPATTCDESSSPTWGDTHRWWRSGCKHQTRPAELCDPLLQCCMCVLVVERPTVLHDLRMHAQARVTHPGSTLSEDSTGETGIQAQMVEAARQTPTDQPPVTRVQELDGTGPVCMSMQSVGSVGSAHT